MLRLPPPDFVFSDADYSCVPFDDENRDIADGMRLFYPELSHWRDDALFDALGEYGEHVEFCADFSVPTTRNEALIGYLYACQVMPVYRFIAFNPKDIDAAWLHYDAGTSEAHARDLFDRLPILEHIFESKTQMIELLSKK